MSEPNATPTEPGWYWMNQGGSGWTIVQIGENGSGLSISIFGRGDDWGLEGFIKRRPPVEWGPRVEPPAPGWSPSYVRDDYLSIEQRLRDCDGAPAWFAFQRDAVGVTCVTGGRNWPTAGEAMAWLDEHLPPGPGKDGGA